MLLPRRSDIKYSRDCIATFLGNPGAKRTTLLPARVSDIAALSRRVKAACATMVGFVLRLRL